MASLRDDDSLERSWGRACLNSPSSNWVLLPGLGARCHSLVFINDASDRKIGKD